MNDMDMILEMTDYLSEALGIHANMSSWNETSRLPQYLRQHYSLMLAQFHIGNEATDCLIAIDNNRHEQPASVTSKQMDRLGEFAEVPVIYSRATMTSYNRKRLLQRNLPFIVPGNQLYIPFLGVDLREHFRETREMRTAFRPATQVLLLYVIQNREVGPCSSQELAHALQYSKMTLTRALNQLELADIGEHSRQGRERLVSFPHGGRSVWEKALPYLKSPVQRSTLVLRSNTIGGLLSGESALAVQTMLSNPRTPTFAYSRDGFWKLKQDTDLQHLQVEEDNACRLEVWKYPPEKLAREEMVDPLSMYLSLMESEDERIQAALEALLTSVKW